MLSFERKGQGQSIVLIHGFLSGSKSFDFIVDALAEQYDVIRVDLPGIGESKMERLTYTVEQYAEEVEKVLQSEGISEAIWIGHSMGGYVALAAAQAQIAHVKQLVLLFSTDIADSEEAKQKRQNQQEEVEEIGVDAFVDKLIGNFFPPNPDEKQVDFMRNVAKDATVEGFQNALYAMQLRRDQQPFVKSTTIPLAIIEGSADNIVPAIETKNVHMQKITVPTGHLGMVENPEAVSDALLKILVK